MITFDVQFENSVFELLGWCGRVPVQPAIIGPND